MVFLKSIFVGACLLTASTVFGDDLSVVQLQQDVRDLQRTVQMQGQKIDDLERQLGQSHTVGGRTVLPVPLRRPLTAETSPLWLTIANWDRVHSGSTELDVIAALGPPTAIRKANDGRQTLLYSLEIAAGGFLSGHVVLSDHVVQETQKPALK